LSSAFCWTRCKDSLPRAVCYQQQQQPTTQLSSQPVRNAPASTGSEHTEVQGAQHPRPASHSASSPLFHLDSNAGATRIARTFPAQTSAAPHHHQPLEQVDAETLALQAWLEATHSANHVCQPEERSKRGARKESRALCQLQPPRDCAKCPRPSHQRFQAHFTKKDTLLKPKEKGIRTSSDACTRHAVQGSCKAAPTTRALTQSLQPATATPHRFKRQERRQQQG
jgi:hypothetical protein